VGVDIPPLTSLVVSIRMSGVDTKESGRRGGLARAKNLTPERRSAIGRVAAKARWGKGGVMEQGQVVAGLALNAGWLEDGGTQTVACMNTSAAIPVGDCNGALTVSGSVTTTGYYTTAANYYYPWYSYPVYVSSPSRPIRLTMSEIERLRKAAKADEKLKAILAKFTEQIEIVVDFA
jgi:hypothetical protein